MKTAKTSWVLILFISILILYVPLYWFWLAGNWSTYSLIENRELNIFPQINLLDLKISVYKMLRDNSNESLINFIEPFVLGDFQEKANLAVNDQIPKRLELIFLAKGLERSLINSAYIFLGDPAIPASINSEYHLLRQSPNFFIQRPALFTDTQVNTIDKRIQNYEKLIKMYPKQKIFVFYFERMAFAPYNPLNKHFSNADQGQSYQYFLKNKPENLFVTDLRLNNLVDHQEYFYMTDHHWNVRGAWKAYEIIYEMLKQVYPDISPKLKLKGFLKIPGAEFCGSYSRRTLYPCTPDAFEYADVDLPEFKTLVNGEEKFYGNKDDYLAGNFSRDKYANHYAEFFGPVVALVEYRFKNDSDRNLLIIGSSYTQAMREFVASHYKNTYVVDLREYKDFSMGKFIKDYKINDILVIGDIIVYGREGWLINP